MNNSKLTRQVILIFVLILATPALAGSTANWSTPENLSGWNLMEVYRFTSGMDGTQALFYPVFDLTPPGNGTLWARVRSPDGTWSAAADLSGAISPVTVFGMLYWDVGVSPDGTAWAVWTVKDSTKPAGADVFVMEAHRPPGGSWSTAQALSAGVADIRTVDFHAGPDGHVAAAWVECDITNVDLSQGNCNVRVRLRNPGAVAWETLTKVDQSAAGVAEAHIRVGPGGLAVVIWNEAKAPLSVQWRIMVNDYETGKGWKLTPDNVSDGWFTPRNDRFLAVPVMDGGGTFVAAWTAMTGSGATTDANYSNTRTSAGSWGLPVKISSDQPANQLSEPSLVVGQDGTLVAAWVSSTGSTSKGTGLYANVREPMKTWGSEMLLSNLEDNLILADVEVFPDGKAMALWRVYDHSKVTSADEGLFWSIRSGGVWGGGGQGQLGDWITAVNGANLIVSPDGSATALWAVIDVSQPADKQGHVLTTRWPSGGPWEAIQTIAGEYEAAYVSIEGLASGPGEQALGAVWLVFQNLNSPNVTAALYYASTGSTNTPPTAVFDVNPPSGPRSTNFLFDASSSSDNEDPSSALEVRWDWQDDGAYDTSWSTTHAASHQYNTAQKFIVRLQVRDTGGMTDTTTNEVITTNNGGGGTVPAAQFEIDPLSGPTSTNFEFDASKSSDNEDQLSVLLFSWDWENDGTFDNSSIGNPITYHKFSAAQTYTVRLEVKDTSGLIGTITHTVTVTSNGGGTWNKYLYLPMTVR
jgi:hypothetical protein